MPTYEYECESCGLKFERRQAITESPLTECPECNARTRRLVSGGTGFILKEAGLDQSSRSCSLEHTGQTCCGREERCGKPACAG
jgi:putative FmdB family regulatory protein